MNLNLEMSKTQTHLIKIELNNKIIPVNKMFYISD